MLSYYLSRCKPLKNEFKVVFQNQYQEYYIDDYIDSLVILNVFSHHCKTNKQFTIKLHLLKNTPLYYETIVTALVLSLYFEIRGGETSLPAGCPVFLGLRLVGFSDLLHLQ